MEAIQSHILDKHEVNVSIHQEDDGTYSLLWDDCVVNEWSENFPALSMALARLASLIACGESEWEKGFTQQPPDFLTVADEFFRNTVN